MWLGRGPPGVADLVRGTGGHGDAEAQPRVVPGGAHHGAEGGGPGRAVVVDEDLALGEAALVEEVLRVDGDELRGPLVLAADEAEGGANGDRGAHVDGAGHGGDGQLALVAEAVVVGEAVAEDGPGRIPDHRHQGEVEGPIEVLDPVEARRQHETPPVHGHRIDEAQAAEAGVAHVGDGTVLDRCPESGDGPVLPGVAQKGDVDLALAHLRQTGGVPVDGGEVVGEAGEGAAHRHGADSDAGEVVDGPLFLAGGGRGQEEQGEGGSEVAHQKLSL